MTKFMQGSFSVGPSVGVDQETVEANWERTFGRKKEEFAPPAVISARPVAPEDVEAVLSESILHLKSLLRAVTSDKTDSAFTNEENYWRKLAIEAAERNGWVNPDEAGRLRNIIRNVGEYLGHADASDVSETVERNIRRLLAGEPVENLWRKP